LLRIVYLKLLITFASAFREKASGIIIKKIKNAN